MKYTLDSLKTEVHNIFATKDIRILSLDIFDTMIFRLVEEPVDVFLLVGERALKQGLLPSYLSKEDYQNIRIEAEKLARKRKQIEKGCSEVTFEEIFETMPKCIVNRKELAKLEYEIEKEVCIVNPVIKDFISWVKEQGIDIICISDMYYSKTQIQDILHTAGYNSEFEIYVSSELKEAKSNGKAYSRILELKNIEAEYMIHIGDNYTSDYLMAKKQRIHAIHYDVLHDSSDKGLLYEGMIYEKNLSHLSSVRRYITTLKPDTPKDMWYNIGAQIYGPFFTMFAEWIVDIAQQENIQGIYPLMREGKLLSQVIQKAADFRKLSLKIKPLYISRKAIYIPSLQKHNKKYIEHIFNASEIKLHDIMKLFGLEEFEEEFREEFGDSREKSYYQMADDFWSFLQRDKVYKFFQQHCDKETDNAYGYFKQMGLADGRCITVDIGFHGTIQKGLETVLRSKDNDYNNIHLLGISPKTTVERLFDDNLDIRGFIGNYGKNDDISNYVTCHPRLLEQAIMCNEPTTKSYRYYNNQYIPVMEQILPEQQKQWSYVEQLQSGILDYQTEYLRLKANYKYISEVKVDVRELLNPYIRLVNVPTREEAQLLGTLSHDENYGVDVSFKLCDTEKIEYIKKYGWKLYSERHDLTQEFWLEGLRTISEDGYEFENLICSIKSGLGVGMSVLANKIKENVSSGEKIVIIGAGQAGKMLLFFLKLIGIEVAAFMDNNKLLQGTFIEGIEIQPLSNRKDIHCYALGTLAFADRLMGQAKELLDEGSSIFCCRDGVASKVVVTNMETDSIW